ncbi:MAG: 2Fe-2S iron-sulfur cluster binding domain-containing protein [Candidatus Gracilibacteria bacterium]|nr:2Fe-2S iron-sulfur cluster binding domain-containing protein [Candidatus Gracilibacteria bacterium]
MVKVTFKDNSGNPITTIDANNDEPLSTQGQAAGAAVPVACGVGACRMCVGKCTRGAEHLDQNAHGEKHISTEEDEFLTCICGVKEDAPDDAEVEIELENL